MGGVFLLYAAKDLQGKIPIENQAAMPVNSARVSGTKLYQAAKEAAAKMKEIETPAPNR